MSIHPDASITSFQLPLCTENNTSSTSTTTAHPQKCPPTPTNTKYTSNTHLE